MIARQAFFQAFKRFLRRVGEREKFLVFRRDGAGVGQRFQVQHTVPVFLAVNDHQNFFGQLARLGQGKDFKQLVQGAKTSGKNHQRLGQVGEPVFTHEEVVKLKIQLGSNVRVGVLLKRQADVEANGFASALAGPAVGGFHNARAAAGGDHKTVASSRQGD